MLSKYSNIAEFDLWKMEKTITDSNEGDLDHSKASRVVSKKFTLDRRRAREIEDLAFAENLCEWITSQTGIHCTSDTLCQVIEESVVLCVLAKKFGQTTRYWDPPKNEFHRRENIALFARACSRLNLSCEMIPNGRGLVLRDVIPCLMELVALAKRYARSMRRIASAIPDSLNDRLNNDMGNHLDGIHEEDIGEFTEFSMAINDKESFSVHLAPSSLMDVTWGGAKVLLKDLMVFQKSRFKNPKHQILCMGAGVTLCGLWAATNGSDVVLTDFPQCIDFIWANVAANAEEIRTSGGSCGARCVDFKDLERDTAMMVADMNEDCELTVLASDALFQAKDLLAMVDQVFKVRRDAQCYIVVHRENVLQDLLKSIKTSVEFIPVYGDMDYRIVKSQIVKS